MTTFSQLVDDIIAESNRPDMRILISSLLNFTVRELHADNQTGMGLRYGANLKELQILTQQENGHVWDIPRAHLFQNLEAVYYPNQQVAPKLRNPGSAKAYLSSPDGHYFFYRTGDAYTFSGYCGVDQPILIAWYERLRRLEYQPAANRLVTWNPESESFEFDSSIAGDPVAEEQALEKASHWMLQRYQDLLGQGTRAKIYARLGDQERARLAYSLYENLRPSLISAEAWDYVPTWNR